MAKKCVLFVYVLFQKFFERNVNLTYPVLFIGGGCYVVQLNITTDYAIRVVIYLSIKKGIVSSKEISEQMSISEKYIFKIARNLSKSGLIKTTVGKNGGLQLSKSPEEISLLDIIRAMENTTKINRCLEEDCYCNRFVTETCPVRKFYCAFQNELERKFEGITISSLIQNA